jgi:hypothetical protein
MLRNSPPDLRKARQLTKKERPAKAALSVQNELARPNLAQRGGRSLGGFSSLGFSSLGGFDSFCCGRGF